MHQDKQYNNQKEDVINFNQKVRLSILIGLIFLTVIFLGGFAQAKEKNEKTQICHATGAIGKPYNKIEVDYSAVNDKSQGNHSSHTGAVFSRETIHQFFDWGDIIPPVENVTTGLNWDVAGQTIWRNNCLIVSPPLPTPTNTPTPTPTPDPTLEPTPLPTPSPEPTLPPTPKPTPTPSPTPEPQARLVINEVYYDVDSSHGGDGNVANSGEWIELYNAGDAAADVQNWTITDNYYTRTITTSHSVNAFGYALIAKDSNIFDYWSIPSGTEIISLGTIIGNGLSNSGDLLILKDQYGNTIDQISWSVNTSILNPAITGVAEGHSIEREPAGWDTNSSNDFIDRLTPTPGQLEFDLKV
ncbi:MAG: hypothetical protein HW405_195 [Candidatus Berkelbacteria bacterium]|nr:hypothetical protein [Candidatus Berkelbacteria bacterium]